PSPRRPCRGASASARTGSRGGSVADEVSAVHGIGIAEAGAALDARDAGGAALPAAGAVSAGAGAALRVVDAPAELPHAIAAAVPAAHVGATFLVDRARLARQRAARAVDAGRPSAARPGSAQARVAGQQAVAGERLALAVVGAALGGAVAPVAELEAHAE